MVAALVAAALMVATRCCTLTDARRGIDWSILTVIGASLGLGAAMEQTGAAGLVATSVLQGIGQSPQALLAAVFTATALLTSLISNNAAVALMFSVALATANSISAAPMPFVIAVMMGGSACFATPIGYQTNLMVMEPGKYEFLDYLKFGFGLQVVVIAAIILVAWVSN